MGGLHTIYTIPYSYGRAGAPTPLDRRVAPIVTEIVLAMELTPAEAPDTRSISGGRAHVFIYQMSAGTCDVSVLSIDDDILRVRPLLPTASRQRGCR